MLTNLLLLGLRKSIWFGSDFTLWPCCTISLFWLPSCYRRAGKATNMGRSGQQIWVGMRNKYGRGGSSLMCWMEFSIHASGTFQSAERSSIAMELLPRDLQRWYRFLSFLDAPATRGPILFSYWLREAFLAKMSRSYIAQGHWLLGAGTYRDGNA